MKNIKRIIRTPAYMKAFRCIGSPCEDNCCIGWDVDFDKKSYLKYEKVREGELVRLFSTCVRPNPDSYSDEVDYASVRLRKGKVCPFLNEEHLCRIQKNLGGSYLSNVCATYPRYTNVVDGIYEQSATVSCPEAARLILANTKGIAFELGEEPSHTRHIITYEANTRDKSNPLRVRHLLELRECSIGILQDRCLPLQERILILGEFCLGVKQAESMKGKAAIPDLIEAFRKHKRPDGWIGKAPKDSAGSGQLALLREIIDSLHVFSEIDSKRYIEYTNEFLKGIRSGKGVEDDEESARAEGFRRFYSPFMRDHEYLLENYLVNFIFKDLFPAAEGENAFDAYMMLVIRYSLIKLHLTGIGINRQGLTEETVVGFIQAFSKTVEHHKTYLESIAEHMINRKYNTMGHMALLLRD